MQNAENLSHEQIREFLRSSRKIEFAGCRRAEIYGWIERTLAAQRYGTLGKAERGLIRAYAEKVTGVSVSQMTRLIRAYLDTGKVRETPYQRHRFATRYTESDIASDRIGSTAATTRNVGSVSAGRGRGGFDTA